MPVQLHGEDAEWETNLARRVAPGCLPAAGAGDRLFQVPKEVHLPQSPPGCPDLRRARRPATHIDYLRGQRDSAWVSRAAT